MRLFAAGLVSVVLAAGTLSVTSASQGCDFHVSPTRVELDTAARGGTIAVGTQPGCAWTVDSSEPWLHLSTAGGSGSGQVPYTTDAPSDPASTPRQGRIRVRWNTPTQGQDVLVTQNGAGCRAFFAPGGAVSPETFGGERSAGAFNITADLFMSTPWRFVSAPDWIAFTEPPLNVVRAGDGSAFFDVAANPSPSPRDGIVTFCSGQTMTIHQAGRSPRGPHPVAGDFDDDGRTDPAIYRPSTNTWWVLRSASGYADTFAAQFGTAGVFPMPGDYDGDNRSELAVYDPHGTFGAAPAGNWTVRYSSNGYNPGTQTSLPFPTSSEGYTPADVPLLGDFNADGRPDFVAYRDATGEWSVVLTNRAVPSRLPQQYPTGEYNGHWQWGLPGDVPVPGDYDGDGYAELAVWRPSNGLWFLRLSGQNYNRAAPAIFQWGLPGDRPIVGDFDGDRRADLAVWRPSEGVWYIVLSSAGYSPAAMIRVQWGLAGDVPVSGDYDGDGRTDLAVWRPSNGFWYILFSSRQYSYAFASTFQWGLPGDVPLSGRITGAQ